ncbi:MAG: hypothetical protein P9M14_06365 [Candidatus Alcyoniella australis]|nr:hypothetical protein [Candidatus Alcyoniella australis]
MTKLISQHYLLLTGLVLIVALVAAAFAGIEDQRPQGLNLEHEATMDSQANSRGSAELPPIDQSRPQNTQIATFALG